MNFGDLGVILDSEKNQERFYLKKKNIKEFYIFFSKISLKELLQKLLKNS